MGLWSKKKVDPLDLNKGYEWTKDDQVAVEELNAMTNCSLYAQDFVEKLVTNIDVSEAGVVGTPSVTLVDGDGATEGKPYKKFKFANLKGEKGDTGGVAPVVQNTGTATGSVMSQNAVTTELESRAKSDASNLTNENIASWANKFFPVGSIYMSVDSTSPASFLGGTWEQIKDRFLLGAGDTYRAGETGGNTIHSHNLNNGYAEVAFGWEQDTNRLMMSLKTVPNYVTNTYNGASYWPDPTGTAYRGSNYMATTLGGTTDAQTTLPPYIVVYIWKRIA